MIQCKRVMTLQEANDGCRAGRSPVATRNKKRIYYDEWCKTLTPSMIYARLFSRRS